MSKLDAIIAQRTATRRQRAEAVAARALDALHAQGIDIRVFGSLARGDFMAHSDVDFLVRGRIDRDVRVVVERTVAQALRGSDLPYDIIYLDDLTAEQAAAFDRG